MTLSEKQNIYKFSINNKGYLIIITIDNKWEKDVVLKAIESFDIIETFKTKIIYIKYNNKINFLEKDDINKKFTIIIDIKSSYSVKYLIEQIVFHDNIIHNILDTCCEEKQYYYYFFILTDKK